MTLAISETASAAMRLVRDGTAAAGDQAHALFALANGLVGVEGVADERADAPACYLPEAYVSRPIAYHESFPGYATATDTRIKCPSPMLLRLHIDGVPVDFRGIEPVENRVELDLESGQLARRSRWPLADGRLLEIAAQRIVPLDGGACVASRVSITPVNFAASIQVWLTYGAAAATGSGDADDPRISGRLQSNWTLLPAEVGDTPDVTRFGQDAVELAYRQHVASPGAQVAAVQAGHIVRRALGAGEELAIDRVVTLACARGAPAVIDQPMQGFDAIAEAQRVAVAHLWDRAAFAIEGDDALTLCLRFNLFQLHQSASRSPSHSIAAKGLSGEGYEGHYFWDAEAFMLPVLALQAPDKARNLLAYRIGKLDQARAHAAALGHRRGALYPWRTIAGAECSSHYPTGSAQYHINGDIAHGVQLYVAATGDEAFRGACAEMLFETARMWLEIGAFDARRGGAFCIYGVTGPDEYSALVDNDFYTNAIARHHLAYAADTADWLRGAAPDDYAALAAAIGLDAAEVAEWRAAADAIWLAVDAIAGVNPQDDAFLARPPLPGLKPLGERGPLLLGLHPMILFRHQVSKQGNVVQAMAMDLVSMPLSLKERNFAYYEQVTAHDSTLSSVAFATMAARLGQFDEALEFYRECAFVDLEDRHGNTSHGLHMAALAGSWLVLAQGWGGLALDGPVPSFRPVIPAEWTGYRFRLCWRGSVIELAVDRAGCTYRLLAGDPLEIADHGRPLRVGADPVFLSRPALKGVIFDLDGVLTDTAEDHYQAWQTLADRHGLAFDREANHRLKGVDRAGSLRLILGHAGAEVDPERFDAMLAEKNDLYRTRLAAYSPSNLFPGVRELFAACRAAGLKIGLASASRNAPDVVRLLGIAGEFDFIADAGAVAHAKPAPDIFLACAAGMGLSPDQCIGVEDARAGVSAIHAAGMVAIGIGSEEALPDADLHVPAIGDLSIGLILSSERDAAMRGRLSNRPEKVEEISC
ncbi:beta-phosphoglucomutase [Sphingopyxis sp. H115]|uniref:beta-phosphoglucomutase n=1 Tax=Sphingopyxis sp. H115 TaxID=1759073 RepID=UPI000737814A|nr:beta-phosphoglucomutase [Sphingopyxis sp. H115]KTE13742.1 beta-phosphoglucomutase [Sphingopyxis sp. H115]